MPSKFRYDEYAKVEVQSYVNGKWLDVYIAHLNPSLDLDYSRDDWNELEEWQHEAILKEEASRMFLQTATCTVTPVVYPQR